MRSHRFATLLFCIAPLAAQTPNEIVTGGYSVPDPGIAAARGQVLTLFVKGLDVLAAEAPGLPLPTTLSGVSVKVTSQIPNYPQSLPILRVLPYDFCAGRTATPCPLAQVTVEIPTEPKCVRTGLFPDECTINLAFITLTIYVNGVAGQSFPISLTESQPHLLNGCDTIFGLPGICNSVATHADGAFIGDAGNPNARPARPGEIITLYAVGLGVTDPIVPTGQASPASPLASIQTDALALSINYRVDSSPAFPAPSIAWVSIGRSIYPSYVSLVAGYVGLYQINVTLPDELSQAQPWTGVGCQANTRIAIGANGLGTNDLTHIDVCVQP